MACGCPVAAAPSGAIPEVCGDAALYFDPTSPESIAETVEQVLEHPVELVARGLERAAGFSWDACARGHEAVYRELSA
jgi:glycosyltransferase involved in cell wall biosynthesis